MRTVQKHHLGLKAGVALACCVCNLAAGASASPKTKATAPVDMSVEWLRNTRPAITDLKPPPGMDPQMATGPIQTWNIRTSDRVLSTALLRWSQSIGWQMIWDAERDFPIEVDVDLHGDISSALDQVMRSLAKTDYPLQVVLNMQARIIRIRRQFETQP